MTGHHENKADWPIDATILLKHVPHALEVGTVLLIPNAEVDVEDVEYLERVLERVPSFAEVYVLVAKAYLIWGESSTALETLLDGHKNAPDDPEIIALLSETLWESGEEDLALSYLNKGINNNPTNVPLLALAGQYLFDDGQEEAAKAYLLRAEMISPRDPTLIRVRQYIGRILHQ